MICKLWKVFIEFEKQIPTNILSINVYYHLIQMETVIQSHNHKNYSFNEVQHFVLMIRFVYLSLFTRKKSYPKVKFLMYKDRKRILVSL